MKTMTFTCFLAIVSCLASFQLKAQENDQPTTYHIFSYMKVKPGMGEEYIKMEKAYKKLHAASIKKGKLAGWTLYEVISPSGADVPYNYVTRNAFRGEENIASFFDEPYFPENWTSLLTAEEIDLVMRTSEIRTLVRNEVWAGVDDVMADDAPDTKIRVVNYFAFPEGKYRSDHVNMEQTIWKPVHEARIKDGTMKGWVLLRKVLPFGADEPYHDITVDVYSDMKQFMQPMDDSYFQKVHPGKNVDDLIRETRENSILVKGDVWRKIDSQR